MGRSGERGSVDAVLFDFDGTLVDASEAICRAFDEALALRGREPFPHDEVRRMIGRPLRDMFAEAHPGAGPDDLEAYVAGYREAFGPLAVPLSRPMPTAVETVDALAPRMRLGVVTTRASEGAVRILHALGLLDRFGTIVGLERVDRPKPAPEAVLVALEELGARAERAVMVGDTPDDVLAGRAAGTRTVGVTTGVFDAAALVEAGADHVIARLAELPPLLR